MSYRIFLDSFLLPFKVGEGPAIEAMNTAIKSDRQKLKRIFTEAGQPGDMFRLLFALKLITGGLVVVVTVMIICHIHQKTCCGCQCRDCLPQSVTLDVTECWTPIHCELPSFVVVVWICRSLNTHTDAVQARICQ